MIIRRYGIRYTKNPACYEISDLQICMLLSNSEFIRYICIIKKCCCNKPTDIEEEISQELSEKDEIIA